MRKYKALFYLSGGLYSLFLYLLISGYKKEETLFLFTNKAKIPSFIKKQISYIKYFVLNRGSILYYVCRFHSGLVTRILSRKYRKTPFYLVSNGPFVHFFDNIIAIEDGLMSYLMVDAGFVVHPRKNKFSNWFFGPDYPDYGCSDKVHKIYMTGIRPIPEVFREKAQIVNIQQLWDKKSKTEQEEIISLFFPDNFDITRFSDRKNLLLTQPLSEDGWTTEKDKIELYKLLLSSYDEEDLTIKVHPRDETDYSVFFPKAVIIDYPCPMELLTLMGFKITTAITVNSTAISLLDNCVTKIMLDIDDCLTLMNYKGKEGMKQLLTEHYFQNTGR